LVAGGTLLVNGTIGDVHVDSSSTLAGTGTTGAVTSVGGIVSPGASPGKLSTGDLLLDSDSKFNAELNGTAPGSGYDQLAVTGTVSLGGAALNLSASGFPHGGAPYVLIDNDGSDPVSGTFAGRPEGSVIDLAGAKLQLSYAGATGNDVTLTVVKQATTTTVTGAPDPVTAGTPVDLTAVVAGPQGFPAPTGTVTFTDGGTTLGTANLAGGSANLTVTSLSAGDHTITATYGGDGDFLGSSGSLNKHVDAAPVVTAAQPTLPTVSVANATGKETDPVRKAAVTKGKLVFVVSLSKTSRTTVAVRFATRNGTARAGKDYKRKAGKLTFRPGVRKLKITVKLLPDNRKEKTEKLKLKLSKAVGATIRRGTAIGTIRDDD
jgi:hypothetical protein